MVAVNACNLQVAATAVAAAAAAATDAVAAVRFLYDAVGTLAWAAVDAGKPKVEKRF